MKNPSGARARIRRAWGLAACARTGRGLTAVGQSSCARAHYAAAFDLAPGRLAGESPNNLCRRHDLR